MTKVLTVSGEQMDSYLASSQVIMDKKDAGNMIVLTLIELFILRYLLFLYRFQGNIQLLLFPRRHFRHL